MNELCFVLDRLTELDFNMPAYKRNSLQEDTPLYPDILFLLWADQSLFLLLNAATFNTEYFHNLTKILNI